MPAERRRSIAAEHKAYYEPEKSSWFGSLTKENTLERELMLARQNIAELTSTNVTVREENSLLRSQLLRFKNIVKPDGGILSARVDTSEYWLNNYRGRKDKLSMFNFTRVRRKTKKSWLLIIPSRRLFDRPGLGPPQKV